MARKRDVEVESEVLSEGIVEEQRGNSWPGSLLDATFDELRMPFVPHLLHHSDGPVDATAVQAFLSQLWHLRPP